MIVTELGDCSVVIENGRDDSMDIMFDKAEKKKVCMIPLANEDEGAVMHVASDYIYTSKTIILYFKDMLDNINIGDRVALIIDGIVYL